MLRRPGRQPRRRRPLGARDARARRPTAPSAAPRSPRACTSCPTSCASCARRWPSSAAPPTPRRRRWSTSTRAPQRLEHLFTHLGPFARSSQLNLRSLADASEIGLKAARHARPGRRRAQPLLRQGARAGQQPQDRARRPRRPRPRDREGPALARAARATRASRRCCSTSTTSRWRSTSSTPTRYILKANLFQNNCSDYQNADSLQEELKSDPDFLKECAAYLGPSQQGVLQPDPTQDRHDA